MIEFSCFIGVTLLTGSKRRFEFMADEFTFQPSVTNENGGTYWDCDKTFVVDMPDLDALNEFAMPRNSIVTLAALSGRGAKAFVKTVTIGSDGIPARALLVPHLNKVQLIVTCKMLHNPLG